jgi:hypothetical protein
VTSADRRFITRRSLAVRRSVDQHMKRIDTHIDINATPERVWGVLTDFAAYTRRGF